MKEYLLLFTIGPVQSFISNSRKMRDLYAGSFLLSHLILHTCNMLDTLHPDIQVERIIPVVDPDKTASAPNRILLKVRFQDDQCLKEKGFIIGRLNGLAKYMEREVRSEFKRIYEAIFDKCDIVPKKNMVAQLENFPEVYWAYQECEGKGADFERITSKLQAVKSLRPFSQTAENAGRKCSLFPEYNALFYRSKDNNIPKYVVSDAVEFTGEGIRAYALKPGEGLSALAFVKRMLYCISNDEFLHKNNKDVFPHYNNDNVFSYYNKNIVSVAYMLLNHRFGQDTEGQALLKQLSPEAAEAVFDLQNGFSLSQLEYKQEDQDAAEAIHKYMQEKELLISPYYAVVKFDGDNMGELYRKCSAEQQAKLSKEIGRFAKLVPSIMKDYNGMCIYAGGEDFLGFFPTVKVLPALIALRQEFQKTVKNPVEPERELTLSAGIAIAHLMPPLKNVLALADKMEHLAKNYPEGNPTKDCFAIAVSKRSGTETHLCNRFGKNSANLEALCKISELIRSDTLSVSSVYNLLSVLEELLINRENLDERMLEPIIVSSICPPEGKEEKDKQNTDEIFALYKEYNSNTRDFAAALEIATFLGKEEL